MYVVESQISADSMITGITLFSKYNTPRATSHWRLRAITNDTHLTLLARTLPQQYRYLFRGMPFLFLCSCPRAHAAQVAIVANAYVALSNQP